MLVPLPPVLTYRSRAFLPEKAGTPEAEFFQRILEAEWVALVFSRWCSDIPQRGLMWALAPRLRRGVNELGLVFLLRGSKYSLATVTDWLWEHDHYDWGATTMLHKERCPNPGDVPRLRRMQEFVREYNRYRVVAPQSPSPTRGIWADLSPNPMPAPELVGDPYKPYGLDEPYCPRPSQQGSVPQSGRLALEYGSGGEFDRYAPVRPDFRGALAPILAERYPPAVTSSDRGEPLGWDMREIPPTLYQKLREAHLEDCVQHYARLVFNRDESSGVVPVTEEALVTCISSFRRGQQEMWAQIGELQASLDLMCYKLESSEDRVAKAEERTRTAEDRTDVLVRAYKVLDDEASALKRRRGD